MMKRLSLVAAALAIVGASTSAQAAKGYYDAYGYHPPSDRRAAASPAATPSLFGKPAKLKIKQADELTGPKKKMASIENSGSKPIASASSPAKVGNPTGYGAGQIVIDQSSKKLYYTLSKNEAYVYPVAVGKQGFKWTGTKKISREEDWPDWRPPAEMRQRKPNLPEYVAGGPKNPLGAKALYLGNSLYRIHGTNDPKSIGTDASSGCIRMYNGHVVHLASMAGVGTTVHVVSSLK